MADLSLDLNKASATFKDLLVKNNDLILTQDANSQGTNNVLQQILQRISFFLGEWFLDNTQGIPWLQQILVKNPDLSKIDTLLQNAILGTPGVTQLFTYSLTPNFAARIFTLNFSAMSTAGKVNYSGTLPFGGGT